MHDDTKIRIEFLIGLYEMSGGNVFQGVLDDELATKLNVDKETFQRIAIYLKEEGLIKFRTFKSISLAHKGIKELERIMAQTYAEKETLVLKKVYELSGQNTIKPVGFHEMVPASGMTDREVGGICKGLEERGFIEWPGGDYVQITSAGIHAIESLGQPAHRTGGDIYQMTIENLHGGAQQGPGGTQNIQINNQPISEIIPQLTAFIEAIKKETFDDKDDVVRDLEVALEVAKSNPTATASDGVWKRIQTKLTAAKTTMEIAKLAYASLPYWPAIWAFFFS